MRARWSLLTTPHARGALAIVAIESQSLDADLAELGIRPVVVGEARLRDLLGVDRGVVARWTRTRADLFCHAGPAVLRALTTALEALGVAGQPEPDPLSIYPEARDGLEAEMLAALASAPSPRAIDLLLDQPRRWREAAGTGPPADPRLDRLLRPPLVVALGAPNIGKSTLLNALAGRQLALAADEPGTTRDHVGAFLVLDGLAVRYLDLPGLDPKASGPDAEAQRLALGAAASADLVLACGDAAHPPPDAGAVLGVGLAAAPAREILTVALRTDLGEAGFWADARVSAIGGEGVGDLARAIRRALVPDEALASAAPWRFWGAGPVPDCGARNP